MALGHSSSLSFFFLYIYFCYVFFLSILYFIFHFFLFRPQAKLRVRTWRVTATVMTTMMMSELPLETLKLEHHSIRKSLFFFVSCLANIALRIDVPADKSTALLSQADQQDCCLQVLFGIFILNFIVHYVGSQIIYNRPGKGGEKEWPDKN